jgi:hypothetical protein
MYGFTYIKSQGVALVLQVLGDMPQKRFEFIWMKEVGEPHDIAHGVTPLEALKHVSHLPSMCSKRFLTTKVKYLLWHVCWWFFVMFEWLEPTTIDIAFHVSFPCAMWTNVWWGWWCNDKLGALCNSLLLMLQFLPKFI